MMERYHDFSLDSCLVDGVSIAETLLYKDADDLRVPEFVTDGSVVCDGTSNLGTVSIAPVNAVAAAAFGSAYSRTASGGLEEVLSPREVHSSDNVPLPGDQSTATNPISTGFPVGSVSSTGCDNSYSKWNELVNKLVDSQEDIPSLLLESANSRNCTAGVTSVSVSTANPLPLRISHLPEFGAIANLSKTNSASSNSSSNESSIGIVGDQSGAIDHSMVASHGLTGTSRVLTPTGSTSDFSGQRNLFHGVSTDSGWMTSSELDLHCNSGSCLSDMNSNVSAGSGITFNRNDIKWSNNYLMSSCMGNTSSGSLHRVSTDPELGSASSAVGGKSSPSFTAALSRLRPIVGKCADDNISNLMSGTSSSTSSGGNLSGISSMSTLPAQSSSHLLPLLRASVVESGETVVNNSISTVTSSSVSALMAAAGCSHAFNSSSSSGLTAVGNMVSSVSTAMSTPVYHLTADSLRLASRSQLNPNAEKFVFVPPHSNSVGNSNQTASLTIQQQSQPPPPQHQHQQPQSQQGTHISQHQLFHHGHQQHQHQPQQQQTHQHQQHQQPCGSGTSFLTVQTPTNYGAAVVMSQANASIGSSGSNGNTTSSSSSSCTGSGTTCGTNGSCTAATSPVISSGPTPLPHHLLSLGAISPVTYNFQTKFNSLAEQRKSLDRERNRIEAELCRQYPGKRITSGVCGTSLPPAVKSCNSSDRVDRELNAVLGNHTRVVALIAKMEKLQNGGDPLPSHVHSTMECWLEGIRKCQARRKEELVNMTNRQRSGPRQQDEKDVIALTLALAELTEHMRRARTALWAALQMTHKDRASSAREAFRFLEHVRRHGLMVLIPPHSPASTLSTSLRSTAFTAGNSSSSSGACGDGGLMTAASMASSIITATHPLLSVQ